MINIQLLRIVICVLFVCNMSGAPLKDTAAEAEYGRFESTWRFALVEVDGVRQPEAAFETNKVIICRDRRYVVVQNAKITRGVFKVDVTKQPRQIDFTVTEGATKGQTILGIYDLAGDIYTFCGSFRSAERPTALKSEPGSGVVFEVLKRERQTVERALRELDGSAN